MSLLISEVFKSQNLQAAVRSGYLVIELPKKCNDEIDVNDDESEDDEDTDVQENDIQRKFKAFELSNL